MTEDDVQCRVVKALADVLNRAVSDIPFGASLRKDLEMDSLKLMTLFIVLEDEFHQTISPEQVADVDTVQGIIDFVIRKMEQTSAA